MHLNKFRWLQQDSNTWLLRCWCSALTNWAMKSLTWELINLLGSTWALIVHQLSAMMVSSVSVQINFPQSFRQGLRFIVLIWEDLKVRPIAADITNAAIPTFLHPVGPTEVLNPGSLALKTDDQPTEPLVVSRKCHSEHPIFWGECTQTPLHKGKGPGIIATRTAVSLTKPLN